MTRAPADCGDLSRVLYAAFLPPTRRRTTQDRSRCHTTRADAIDRQESQTLPYKSASDVTRPSAFIDAAESERSVARNNRRPPQLKR